MTDSARTFDLPFTIVAIAPFTLENSGSTSDVTSIPVDIFSIDQVMESLNINLYVALPEKLCPAEGIEITIKRMKDFKPGQMILTQPFLKKITGTIDFIKKARSEGQDELSIYEQIMTHSDFGKGIPEIEKPAGKPPATKKIRQSQTGNESAIDNILDMVAIPQQDITPKSSSSASQSLVSQYEDILNRILTIIFQNDQFRQLEAAWRGLKLLLTQKSLDNSLSNNKIQVKIVPAFSDTLEKTLGELSLILAYDDLPSLVIADFSCNNSPVSMDKIKAMCNFAEVLMIPLVSWIEPDFFHIDSLKDMDKLSFLPHHFEKQVYAKWQKIKSQSAARWLTLTVNRFLIRSQYGLDNRAKNLDFIEKRPLWISSAWAAASLIAQSAAKTGWPTCFTDYRHFRLDNLGICHDANIDHLSTETDFSEDRIRQMIDSGIMPLVPEKGKDVAFFPAESSVFGSSSSYQMLVSQIAKMVMWCIENSDHDSLEKEEIAQELRQTMIHMWEKKGHMIPDDFKVSGKYIDQEQNITLSISLTPPREILRSGEKIELEFNWL
ncbi:type VI secretion system contractile sheath large subunit [Desulfobacterales bacterium HSG16]|nr:type VI secretion system contractile sheath large subunit [Desulfobacterales bacterium HSG16]